MNALHYKAKELVNEIGHRYLGWYGKSPDDMSRAELIERVQEMEASSREIARLTGKLERQIDQYFLDEYLAGTAGRNVSQGAAMGGTRG
jgi:hypothetical protein